jgi:tetratricopeptide (TPR) repeat protein
VAGAPVSAQEHEHAGIAPERLGTVHFETSCDPAVRTEFDRATALLHSFWFSAAIDGFNKVLAKDPGCSIAHWGIGMSRWGNPFGGFRSPKALEAGLAAVAAARAANPRTDRERGYIEAVSALFTDYTAVDQRTRTLAYEKAMETLTRRFPDDTEAAAFYALALAQTALPTDKTYANQLKAAAILETLFKEQPDHPGLAHYMIHSYDVPALAPRALDAARRYARIAPSAPHALHMPSHTFTRLGLWEESIETNLASAEAARRDNAAAEELHALDYQTYAYLQTGQDRAAARALEQIAAIAARIDPNAAGAAAPAPAGYFAFSAIPARYALERGAWTDAAQLPLRDNAFRWTEALTRFARALGAARSGRPDEAMADADRLGIIRDALKQVKEEYWAGQADIQRRAATAWIEFARGQKAAALVTLREAVDLEDATEKAAVTPGPLAPARELLAEMLLESGDAASAFAEFENALRKEPGRFRSVYGAARAAELAGDKVKATDYYRRLTEICRNGDDPGRPELIAARRFVKGS